MFFYTLREVGSNLTSITDAVSCRLTLQVGEEVTVDLLFKSQKILEVVTGALHSQSRDRDTPSLLQLLIEHPDKRFTWIKIRDGTHHVTTRLEFSSEKELGERFKVPFALSLAGVILNPKTPVAT